MATPRAKTGSRGNALLVVVFFIGMVAAVVGWYFHDVSAAASRESTTRENQSAAQSYAVLATELAISNLSDVDLGELDSGQETVLQDWVAKNIYGADGTELGYERRLSGNVGGGNDGFDYVVRVRPVREAKGTVAVSDTWMQNVKLDDYDYGEDPARKFTAAYEVTSVARNVKAADSTILAGEGSVQTVIAMNFNSAYNELDKVATLHGDAPGNFVDAENLPPDVVKDSPDDVLGIYTSNFLISGEDHYATKSVAKTGLTEKTIGDFASIKATPSDLYSVRNPYWTWGKMTLHYMKGHEYNPKIPRTPYFRARVRTPNNASAIGGNSDLDQDMIVLDPNRDADQYVYGGKIASTDYINYDSTTGSQVMYEKGRSITLEENNPMRIVEVNEAQATPDPNVVGSMAGSALAVSKYENIIKLYLNYVEPSGSTASWPTLTAPDASIQNWKRNNWRQMSLGYHSAATSRPTSTQMTPARRPLDNYLSTARRRWATLVWIKNEHGQFLVREYDGTYSSPTNSQLDPNGNWTGAYTWAWYGGYNSTYKYHIGAWIDSKLISMGTNRNYKKNLNTRFLTMEEMLGYQLQKPGYGKPTYVYNKDEIPAKLNASGNAIAGIPDYALDEMNNRIPYDPDGTGTVFNESYQRRIGNDNFGLLSTPALMAARYPPTDGIYVRLPNGYVPEEDDVIWTSPMTGGRYKRHQTIQDFYHIRDIKENPDDPKDERKMTSLHMVLESEPERTAQDDGVFYFDMGLTVTVVFPEPAGTSTDIDLLEGSEKQWWEGDKDEALNGEAGIQALSANPTDETLAITDGQERLKALFHEFGFYSENLVLNDVLTMVHEGGDLAGFPRAFFNKTADTIAERKKLSEGAIALNEKINSDYGLTRNTYYYGLDDIFYFMSLETEEYEHDKFEWSEEDLELPEKEHNVKWLEECKKKVLWKMRESNPGATFKELHLRFDPSTNPGFIAARLSDDELRSLMIPHGVLKARGLASVVFGTENPRVPGVYAKWTGDGTNLQQLTNRDFSATGNSDKVAPVETTVSLLPGELSLTRVKKLEDGLQYESDPLSYVGLKYKLNYSQPNARPLAPKFIWLENPKTPLDPDYDPDVETIHNVHDVPKWFTNYRLESGTMYNLYDFVLDDCPREYSDFTGWPRDHRGSLGWHREGPKVTVIPQSVKDRGDSDMELAYQAAFSDNYEFVMMAKQGFNPYYTMEDSGKEFIALVDPTATVGQILYTMNKHKPILKPPSAMPTFVISGGEREVSLGADQGTETAFREIDGAGVLVVNGNLTVNTRFAYHGVVVVLGDLNIVPKKTLRIDERNNLLDEENNIITYISSKLGYYYEKVRQDGDVELVQSGPVYDWLGNLIVQGKVIVGGSINMALEKRDVNGDVVQGPGTLDIRYSQRALDETIGLWTRVGPNENFVANRLSWSTGSVTSGDALWSK